MPSNKDPLKCKDLKSFYEKVISLKPKITFCKNYSFVVFTYFSELYNHNYDANAFLINRYIPNNKKEKNKKEIDEIYGKNGWYKELEFPISKILLHSMKGVSEKTITCNKKGEIIEISCSDCSKKKCFVKVEETTQIKKILENIKTVDGGPCDCKLLKLSNELYLPETAKEAFILYFNLRPKLDTLYFQNFKFGDKTANAGIILGFEKNKEVIQIKEELQFKEKLQFTTLQTFYKYAIREQQLAYQSANRKLSSTAILVDSFGHNIAGHALVKIKRDFEEIVNKDNKLNDTIKYMPQFMKYLIEKSAFWNSTIGGTATDSQFISIYDLLNEFFVDNKLFVDCLSHYEGAKTVELMIKINEKPFETLEKSKELKDELLYLPGTITGKQAFYTILENVIRNAKHSNENISKIELFIEIDTKDEYGFYFTIWLNSPSLKLENNDKCTFENVKSKLDEDIIKEDGNPYLGGLSQMNQCARYLLFGNWSGDEKINNKELDPYITPIKILNNNCDKSKCAECKICIGWKIFVWKGETLYNSNNDKITDSHLLEDNIKRFRFILTKDGKTFRGKVKTVKKDKNNEANNEPENVYKRFLEKVVSKDLYDAYVETDTIFMANGSNVLNRNSLCGVCFQHGKTEKGNNISFGSDGPLSCWFDIDGNNGEIKLKKECEKQKEMIELKIKEVLLTKVIIIDDILNDLLKKNYHQNLKIFQYNEIETLDIINKIWPEEEKPKILLVHFTYLEKYKKEKPGNSMNGFYMEFYPESDGFLFITSSRGNMELLRNDKINENILFIPRIALINAITKSLDKNDEFGIKYNIINVLLGY